jgi:hypothetical protein
MLPYRWRNGSESLRDDVVTAGGGHGSESLPGGTIEGVTQRRASIRGRPAVLRVWQILAPVVAVVMIAVACGGSERPSRQRTERRRDRPRPGESISPPQSSPLPPADGKAFPLGQLTLTSGPGATCPAGQECKSDFEVACPGVQSPATGSLSVTSPSGQARGVVVSFAGGRGTSFVNTPFRQAMQDRLHGSGIVLVEVPWRDSWLEAAPGDEAGPTRLGCRPATVAKWVYDNLYVKLGVRAPGVGRCGFCLSGDSGGASQAAYPITHYGLGDVVNAVILASGPVHTALGDGCLHDRADRSLWFTARFSAPIIDLSYGFPEGSGPCVRHDPAFADRWQQDSMEVSATQSTFPSTRVVFIFGGRDRSAGPPHGMLLFQLLQAQGSPRLELREVPDMGHLSGNSQAGTDATAEEILA